MCQMQNPFIYYRTRVITGVKNITPIQLTSRRDALFLSRFGFYERLLLAGTGTQVIG